MTSRLPAGGAAVRGVMLLGPLAALLAGVPQGYAPPVWLVAVLAVLASASAAMPEHYVGAVTLMIVVVWWVIEAGDALPLSSVAAAGALVAAHLAGTVAAYGPRQLAPDREVVLLWVRRGLALWATAALTWFVVVAGTGRATSGSAWVVGLAAGLVLAIVATVRYSAPERRA